MALLSAALVSRVALLPGAERLLAQHRRELPQRDELCGAFCALLALRAAGVAGLDQEAVAVTAGSVLSPPPRTDSLPPGEPGRGDYRLLLPEAGTAAESGTSAHGVAAAVERLSGGALAVVPASGPWSDAVLRRLLARMRSGLPDAVAVLANVATGALADTHADVEQLSGYLDAGVDAAPGQRWSVGHFVVLAGVLEGAAGALVLVADTYRSLGTGGLHLQPARRVAAALRRDGMAPGGILLVVPAARRGDTEEVVKSCSLRAELWDNGSPAPT